MERKGLKLFLLLFSLIFLILLVGGSYYYFQVRERTERTQARKTGERWFAPQADEDDVLGSVNRYTIPIDPFKGHAFRYGRISKINKEERTMIVDVGKGETVKVFLPEGITVRIEKESHIGDEWKDLYVKGSLLDLEEGDVVRIVGPSDDPNPLLQSEITAWALEVNQ